MWKQHSEAIGQPDPGLYHQSFSVEEKAAQKMLVSLVSAALLEPGLLMSSV